VVWSLLNQQDFSKSGASETELAGVIDELIINTPNAEVVVILYESSERDIKVIVSSIQAINGLELYKEFSPEGTRNFSKFKLEGKSIIEAEALVLNAVRKYYQNLKK